MKKIILPTFVTSTLFAMEHDASNTNAFDSLNDDAHHHIGRFLDKKEDVLNYRSASKKTRNGMHYHFNHLQGLIEKRKKFYDLFHEYTSTSSNELEQFLKSNPKIFQYIREIDLRNLPDSLRSNPQNEHSDKVKYINNLLLRLPNLKIIKVNQTPTFAFDENVVASLHDITLDVYSPETLVCNRELASFSFISKLIINNISHKQSDGHSNVCLNLASQHLKIKKGTYTLTRSSFQGFKFLKEIEIRGLYVVNWSSPFFSKNHDVFFNVFLDTVKFLKNNSHLSTLKIEIKNRDHLSEIMSAIEKNLDTFKEEIPSLKSLTFTFKYDPMNSIHKTFIPSNKDYAPIE